MPPRTLRTKRNTLIAVGFAGVIGLALGACSSSDGDAAEPLDAPTTSTTESAAGSTTTPTTEQPTATTASTVAPTPSTTPDQAGGDSTKSGLYDVRYCEVLLLRSTDGEFSAEVWNTLGENDCPQAEWDQLDAAAIATERNALAAILNGPRYWVLDSITSSIRENAAETTFGSLGMFQAAVIDFGTEPPTQTPYVERSVVRENAFGFAAGREIYELTSPDGTTYVMQTYSQIIDETLTSADLAGLDARIEQPAGWTFTARTLTEDLAVNSTDGVATVIQDDLQNTYQRIDAA